MNPYQLLILSYQSLGPMAKSHQEQGENKHNKKVLLFFLAIFCLSQWSGKKKIAEKN